VIDVTELLTDPEFVSAPVTCKRPVTTYSNAGVPSQSYPTSVSVTGIVQDACPEDVEFLPEGVRLADVKTFYTAGDVSAGDGEAQLPDVLEIGALKYVVQHVQDFRETGGYVRVLAQRQAVST
jgi:hypothetical protein